jgi:hypothetical protein
MNANAERWEEELELVPEEMRRTLAAYEWQASNDSDNPTHTA